MSAASVTLFATLAGFGALLAWVLAVLLSFTVGRSLVGRAYRYCLPRFFLPLYREVVAARRLLDPQTRGDVDELAAEWSPLLVGVLISLVGIGVVSLMGAICWICLMP